MSIKKSKKQKINLGLYREKDFKSRKEMLNKIVNDAIKALKK